MLNKALVGANGTDGFEKLTVREVSTVLLMNTPQSLNLKHCFCLL